MKAYGRKRSEPSRRRKNYMKKKLFAVGASALMLASQVGGVVALAADDTKSTNLTYKVDETYTWSIHSAVDFDSNAGVNKTVVRDSNAVAVTKCVLAEGHVLHISVKGNGTSNAFTITNGGTEILSYTVVSSAIGTNALTAGADVLTNASGAANQSTNMTFTLATTSKAQEVAGTYSGTVTYTAAIK